MKVWHLCISHSKPALTKGLWVMYWFFHYRPKLTLSRDVRPWPWPWPWHKSLGLAIFKTEARKPQCHSAPVSLSLSHTLLCQCLLKWYCLFEYAFCAPTSSAPVERIFSQSRLITRRNRARMMDSMLESLVFLHCKLIAIFDWHFSLNDMMSDWWWYQLICLLF